ncbi:phage portal protein family protein [Endozoicomonas sp. ALB115]|uniref:phage portal protein family protein n=1 Tax=Endozoicomonas sp. ALB115 TaxID=3403074 RepID=UPI003BB4C81F
MADVEQLTPDEALNSVAAGSGLHIFSGYIAENTDYDVPELNSLKTRCHYMKKMTRSGWVAAMIHANKNILRSSDWSVKPADDSDEAKAVHQFVMECFDDMDSDFDLILDQIIDDRLTYGFGMVVPAYKLRRGDKFEEPIFNSQYNDKRFGWRHMTTIKPSSLLQWDIPDAGTFGGTLRGIVQQLINGQTSYIPRERFAIYNGSDRNPEGKSILEPAFKDWWSADRLSQLQLVGLEKDLSGLPVGRIPEEYLKKNATEDQKALTMYMKNIVSQMRRNHLSGMLLPSTTGEDGKYLIDVTLMGSPGSGKETFSMDLLREFKASALSSALLDFLSIGQNGNSGSYNLASTRSQLWSKSIQVYLNSNSR